MEMNEIINRMTLQEKSQLLTEFGPMGTRPIEEYRVPAKTMADGPHGVRFENPKGEENSTHFPNLCALASSWSREAARRMGKALGKECRHHGKQMLLGPGINIKRHILCGRNFEYLSEDPVLAGELAAAYINGLQEEGISACVKHFAVNSQEKDRTTISAQIDERTLREIYLKAFQIAVQKGKPDAVMCAYNRLNAIWCSENRFLLTQVLREEWGFQGLSVSDWGAVHDTARAIMAGMDLIMPFREGIFQEIQEGLEKGKLTETALNQAVEHMIEWARKNAANQEETYDRNLQHEEAVRIAAESMVLLKNENQALPLTSDKYRRIAVIGEFAKKPLIGGQGSAEVYPAPEYIDSPLEQLKSMLPDTEFRYLELYQKGTMPSVMLWPQYNTFRAFTEDCETVLFFAGEMESESTENFDRRSAQLNPNYEFFIEAACDLGKKVIVVLQSGGALILGKWRTRANAILQMWMGGEGAGTAIAQLLTGQVNPSGKLSETFPTKLRDDIDFGDGACVVYREGLEVGYRYYDHHPEEIAFPFGHGLCYTHFVYESGEVLQEEGSVKIRFMLKNIGDCAGAEIAQIYIGQCSPGVIRPIKELKAFEKVYLMAGEAKRVEISIPISEFGYYNIMLHEWVTETDRYRIYVGASSRDIRLQMELSVKTDMPYSMTSVERATVG